MPDEPLRRRAKIERCAARRGVGAVLALSAMTIGALCGCAGKDTGPATRSADAAQAESGTPAPQAEDSVQRIATSIPTEPEGVLAADAVPFTAPTEPARRGFFGSLIPSSSSPPSVAGSAAESSTPSLRKPAKPAGPSLDERLLFFPAKFPVGDWQPTDLRFEDAAFTSADGTRLHGWYCPSDEPAAVILYCHGNAGNVTGDAELFRFMHRELRATVLGFDYRGYGKSEGRATAAGVIADARAARAWLAARAGVPESSIVLMGRSLGGAVAVQLTADVRPRGLILESTFDSLRAMAQYHYKFLAGLVPQDKLDSAAVLARYDGPLLQSHGDHDRTIPITSGEALFVVAKGRKEFFRIEGGDHNDPQPPDYYARLVRFVAALP